jgi:uncharacterized membrane protein
VNLRLVVGQLADGVIVLYSLVVLASIAPSLRGVDNILLVPYFLLVPGYVLTALLYKSLRKIGRLFYTVIWGVVLVVSVSSLEGISAGYQILPPSIVIPIFTLVIFTYNHFHKLP